MSKKEDNDLVQGVSVNDYVIPGKVEAFCRAYEPAASVKMADEVFDDAKLRRFFDAGVQTCGDVLAAYMQLLEANGFHYVIDADMATCVLPVRLCNLETMALLGVE